jgi:hypothetical protein
MKLAVYAIAKNEIDNVDAWYANMKGADGVYVLVNNSTDATAARLRELGATVREFSEKECTRQKLLLNTGEGIYPNLGALRNKALAMIPQDMDICVPVDLDDRFSCDTWPDELKAIWTDGAGICRYKYVYSWQPDGTEGISYRHDRIHSRHGWRWTGYVHEWLEAIGKKRGHDVILPDDIYQFTSSHAHKAGLSTLPVLRKQAHDMPICARTAHYHGRELYQSKKYDEAIEELTRHLTLPGATWGAERSASSRYISKCYQEKGDWTSGWLWANRALNECPTLREPWIETMRCCSGMGNVHGALFFGLGALSIEKRTGEYIEEPESWGPYPYECLAWAYGRLGDEDNAQRCREAGAAYTKRGE